MLCLLWPYLLLGQSSNVEAAANQKKAHGILTAAIQALGGPAWLDLHAVRTTGRTAAFFHGDPTGIVAQTVETTAFPTNSLPMRERIDFASKGRVVQIDAGRQGWEITYRGKRDLPPVQLASYLRWRDHSLGMALRGWLRDPKTMLLYEGHALMQRKLMDKVTVLSRSNDAITLEIDATTHLPSQLSFSWHDPQFHDKNLDAVQYDDYHTIDGIATPFTITRTHNGETVSQRYLQDVQYNPALPEGLFDPDRVAAHLK
ncbi:MAG: hypothetical protein WA708_06585 [Acidobacteriaceae bacterium]